MLWVHLVPHYNCCPNKKRSTVYRDFSVTPVFHSYAFWQLSVSWFYSLHECLSPLRPYLLFSSHPSSPTPVLPTIHSLSRFIGIHFSHSLFPLYSTSSCSASLLLPLLPSTNETLYRVQTAFLCGHRKFVSYQFFAGKKPPRWNCGSLVNEMAVDLSFISLYTVYHGFWSVFTWLLRPWFAQKINLTQFLEAISRGNNKILMQMKTKCSVKHSGHFRFRCLYKWNKLLCLWEWTNKHYVRIVYFHLGGGG